MFRAFLLFGGLGFRVGVGVHGLSSAPRSSSVVVKPFGLIL